MREPDVPSPIDLQNPADAREWERTAPGRPGRSEMFRAFVTELERVDQGRLRVLELGSGPGFLAAFLLEALPGLELTLLDVSSAMHDLARIRLGERAAQACFLDLNFKDPYWFRGLGSFDAVVTNQAVHELRHKRYAVALHRQAAGLLEAGAPYLVCDHYLGAGGMADDRLFMTIEEQEQALLGAGFRSVELIGRSGGLVMHRAA